MRKHTFLALVLFVGAVAGCGRDSEPAPTASPTAEPAVVNSLADISLRAGPGPDFDETAQVRKGTPLRLLGSAWGRDCSEWVLVSTHEGVQGWARPLLVNVDIEQSVLPAAPVPTPEIPEPAACNSDLALLQIDNSMGKPMEVNMTGAEVGFMLSLDDGEVGHLCVLPGDYCYDLTDGNKHKQGNLNLPGGECTCWHWGGAQPGPGSCQCSDDPANYQRP